MLLSLLLSTDLARAAGPSTSVVTDTVYRADGTAAAGTLVISWPSFTTADNKPVAAGQKTVKIGAQGAVSIPLVPNFGAVPAGTFYTVTYKLDDGSTSQEYWSVPAAPVTTIGAIRSKLVPAGQAVQYATRQYVDTMLAGIGSGGSGNATKIQGADVDTTAPVRGQSLIFDGTHYKPQSSAIVDVVRDCGAAGDNVTNDAPAIQACINAHPGKTLHFPKTRPVGQPDYYLAATLVVGSNNLILEGEGGGLNNGTILRFASNVPGIRLNGGGDVIRDLSLRAPDAWNVYDPATYRFDGAADGIQLASGQPVLDHVYVYGFSRHGVNADSVAFGGNSNLWKLANVTAEGNRGDGFHFHGSDANAGRCDMCSARLNQGWGFFDDALLPNTYLAPFTEANHNDVQSPAATVAVSSLVRTSHVVTATTASAHNLLTGDTIVVAGATDVTFNGKRVNGVTAIDSTHSTYVDAQGDATCSGACASSATAGFQPGNRIWVQNNFSGGPFYMPKNNTLVGAYAEGAQPWSSFAPNTLVLGFNDGAGEDWSKLPNLQWNGHSTPLTFSRMMRGGGYARTRFIAGAKLSSVSDPFSDAAEGAFGVSNEDAANGSVYSRLSFQRTALGNSAGWWCFTADFAGTEGATRNVSPLCLADMLTTGYIGMPWFPNGIAYGGNSETRRLTVGGLSAPADVDGIAGDLSLTSAPRSYSRNFWGWLKTLDSKYYPVAPVSGCQGSWFCYLAPYKNADGLPAFALNTSGTQYAALYDPGDASGAVALGFTPSITSLPTSPAWKCLQNGTCSFAGQIVSDVPTGSPPLTVASTTPVANLTLASEAQLPTISSAGKIASSAMPVHTHGAADTVSGARSGSRCLHTSADGSQITEAAADCGTSSSSGMITSGLIGQFAMVDASGSTLPDSSGQGNNGTLVNSPAVGALGITFTAGSSQRITLPAGVNTWRSALIFADSSFSALTGGYKALFGNSSNSNVNLLTSTNNDTVNGHIAPALYAGGFSTQSMEAVPPVAMWGVVLDASADKLYINDREVSSYIVQGGNAAKVAGTYMLGGSTGIGVFYSGTIYYALLYNRQLTAAEIAQTYHAVAGILRTRGVQLAPRNLSSTSPLVFDGDSITAGAGATPFSNSVSPSDSFTKFNLGASGMYMRWLQSLAQSVDNLYAPLAAQNVVVIFAGSNDLSGNAATVHNYLSAYCRERRKLGWKVVVLTMISRNGKDADKNAYNALIRQNWRSYADELADIAEDPNLGADGAYANSTYFQADGVHPTNAGQSLIAQYVQAAVNRLRSHAEQMNVNRVTASATLSDRDNLVLCDPSGGNVTITLPSAIGLRGAVLWVKNVQTSGANTCTVAAAASQTIDGNATQSLANLAGSRFVSTGVNWAIF